TISKRDWSSDVCSSDLTWPHVPRSIRAAFASAAASGFLAWTAAGIFLALGPSLLAGYGLGSHDAGSHDLGSHDLASTTAAASHGSEERRVGTGGGRQCG